MLQQRYAWFAARADNGKTALDMLDTDELDADDRPIVEHLRAGWFSVFEVTRVRIDDGLELRDIWRRRTLFVRERSGSRQVALGDLLAGWVLVAGDEITLEGAIAHAPRLLAARAKQQLGPAMSHARQTMRLPWRERHAAMVPVVATIISDLRSQPPHLDLRNNEGHKIVIAEAVYDVVDRARAAAALRAIPELDESGDAPDRDDFAWVDPNADVLVAEVVLRNGRMTLQTNSRERLERVRSTIERAAGDAIVHRADSFADPLSSARADHPPSEPPALPPEAREAMLQELQDRLEAWLDTPVPALGNKTPRSKTRTARGRDDVAAMLMEQEQILQRGGLADELAFAPLWEQLGLRYPGPFPG